MNRNAKVAVGFTFVALLFATAHAQTSAKVTQSGHNKTVIVMAPGRYAFRTGQPEGGGQNVASAKDDLFGGTEQFAKNATDVTEITMDPDTLDLVKGPQGSQAHSMVLNVVRTYTYEKPGMYDAGAVEAYRNKLNSGEWHCSVHVRELKSGESTDVCNKRRTDGMKETAIITVEPKSLTFIHTIKREGAGGHSDVSEMPLIINGRAMPMMAEMMGSAAWAEMDAKMQVEMAKMQAMAPELAMLGTRLGALQKVKPFTDEQLKEFKSLPRLMPLPEVTPKPEE